MEGKKMPPIGVENFEEIRTEDFYYVDKTGMIRDLLNNKSKVTLFTRPRRFGKSLNMSMLRHFFSVEGDKSIFEGLVISKETELCEKHMGKYPVISISLKDVDGLDYETAYRQVVSTIRAAARKARCLRESAVLDEQDKSEYQELLNRNMSESTLRESLLVLSELLERHHRQKVVLLIDEYDVPLQKAFVNGYYDQMVSLIRDMFSAALKTNDHLEFAVLTGCLRVAKESIFTGMNNLNVFSITDEMFSQYFGFTDGEVREMLAYYGLEECYDALKAWYDGYRFGNIEMYCPWDVLSHCSRLLHNPKTPPQNYWTNSSGNDAVREFVRRLDTESARQDLEILADGGTVRKRIRQDLTYRDMYVSSDNVRADIPPADGRRAERNVPQSGTPHAAARTPKVSLIQIENLWSLLFMTGYLTIRDGNGQADAMQASSGLSDNEPVDYGFADSELQAGVYDLSLPNREVQSIFQDQIMDLFFEEAKADGESLQILCQAIAAGDADGVEQSVNGYLGRVISVRDTAAPRKEKEIFYHGLLLGFLQFKADWRVSSNYETGDGYGDILIQSKDKGLGAVIEVKYAHDGNLDKAAGDALRQIEDRRYADGLYQEGCGKVLKYGIACHKKRCKVLL